MTLVSIASLWPAGSGRISARLGKVSRSTAALLALAIVIAFSPNLLWVGGIHMDYETLYYGSSGQGLIDQLFALGRPVAAVFNDVTIWPLGSVSDIRWVRVFSILTACVLGLQMLATCIAVFRMRQGDALAACLAALLAPPLIYSILLPIAWTPHLLTMLFAFGAYLTLSRSNLQALSLLTLIERGQWRALPRQAWAYATSRWAWTACLLYLAALYCYPPNAMAILLFPVIVVLFSPTPPAYRLVIAARDIVFVGMSLVIYFVSAKLVYFPLVQPFVYYNSEAWRRAKFGMVDVQTATNYEYKINFDVGEILSRIGKLMKVAGDIWFLPQTRFYLVTLAVVLLAIGASALATARPSDRRSDMTRRNGQARAGEVSLRAWGLQAVALSLVPAVCFVAAAAPVVLAGGGFVTYRTVLAAIAIAAVVFVWAAGTAVRSLWRLIGNPFAASATMGDAAMALAVLAALVANFYANYETMILTRNELAYIKHIVRTAVSEKAKAIVLVDPRPPTLPENNPEVFDQRGRAVPPFELGCFSGYCLPSSSIVHVAISELSLKPGALSVFTVRGNEPAPGITCELLTAPADVYPSNASDKTIRYVNFYRSLRPFTCVTYSLAWHDLAARPAQ